MSSSNTDSENSFEYKDSDGCYVSEYVIAFEDGDLNDTRVRWLPFGPFYFDKINPFLATFNSLRSRITKERYGVHKYAFGRIRTLLQLAATHLSGIFWTTFLLVSAQSCRSVPLLTSQTKLDPLSFKLGGEPKGGVFSKL